MEPDESNISDEGSKMLEEKLLELTNTQKQMWLLEQLNPNSPTNHITDLVLKINTPVDPEIVRICFQDIIERHESLRTTITTINGEPKQVVHSKNDLDFTFYDLNHIDLKNREREGLKLAAEEARKPFDLNKGPLVRTVLIKLAETEYIISVPMHHIISDGWSAGVIFKDFMKMYQARVKNEAPDLPEIGIQYSEYLEQYHLSQQEEKLQKQLNYWKEKLAGELPVLNFPSDFPKSRVQNTDGARVPLIIPQEMLDSLRKVTSEYGVTLFSVLLAAYKGFLYQLTGQDDIIVGIPTAGRKGRKTRNLVGLFINTLALRTRLNDQLTFEELLDYTQSNVWMGLRNQEIPFTKIVEEVNPDRDLARSSLYQTMFVFQNWPMPENEGPEINVSPVMIDPKKSIVDLAISLIESEFGIHGWMEYSTNLFKSETVELFARYYLRFLNEAITDPKAKIAEIPLVSKEELYQQLHNWNQTSSVYPSARGIHELLEEQVKKSPRITAVLDGEKELSFLELNERANQLANYLKKVGVKPGEVVGFCVGRSVDMVVGLLGIMKAGGVFLPMDPTYPKERLALMLEDSGAGILITEEEFVSGLPEYRGKIVVLDREQIEIAQENVENPGVTVSGEDLAYLIYTSGTTGIPKGVTVRHKNLVNHALEMGKRLGIEAGGRMLQYISISFDASLESIFPVLLKGGTVVVVENPAELVGMSLLMKIEDNDINYLHLPVSVWHQTVIEMERQELKVPESLKLVLVGGEQVEVDRLRGWTERLRQPMLFVNAYGPTEASITATTYALNLEPGGEVGKERIPIGKPLGNVRVYVLNERGEPVPIGLPGELYIGGAGVSAGYHNREDENELAFVMDRFEGDGNLYRTGDIVKLLPDGNLVYLGRRDEQVKLRGYRIELGEIEAVLREQKGVEEAVVMLREDMPGVKILVAYLVGEEVDEEELIEKLGERLPGYMVPGAFVRLDEIPLTPNGKINRKGLPAPVMEGWETYVKPRTRLEELLAEMWGDLLGLEEVSVKANFFDLGGNSLLGATFINRLQAKLGEYLYLIALFDAPTIEELGVYLEENYPVGVGRMLGEELDISQGVALMKRMRRGDIEGLKEKVKKLVPRKQEEAPVNTPATFILSAPRSGSTLLRAILGGNPELFAPPELQLMNYNNLKEQAEAFANERDSFWLDGVVMALMNLQGWSEVEAREALKRWAEERMSVRAFYGQMQAWLGERLFVDKTPNYALDPGMLKRIEEDFQEAKYIHLVRHPYGMIPSFEKAKLHVFYPPFLEEDTNLTVREMAEAIWTISQEHIESFLRGIPKERQLRVSYEALVTRPEEVINEICEFLEIEFHDDMLYPQKDPRKRMTGALHELSRMVGDVRFFEHEGISASGAYRWQEGYRGDYLTEITWQIAERLGYWREDLPILEAGRGGFEIQPVSRERNLPLSFAQQRLWFMNQLEPGGSTYNMPGSFRLVGELDIKALQSSLETIIQRHEILRTRFSIVDGNPIQVIDPPFNLEIPLIDLTDLSEEQRSSKAKQIASEEAMTPFDLSTGPLIRVKLIKEAENTHIILLSLHHIVADAWSIGIFVREFASLYGSFLEGREVTLPDLPIQYVDYSVWQREYLQGDVLDSHIRYWQNQLTPLPPVLEIPTATVRPRVQTFKGDQHKIELPAKIAGMAKKLNRKTDTTFFMVLLAAFMVLLQRYSGEEDICVGTPAANRGRTETEGLIGFFVNMLAMRGDLSGDPSFLELLQRIREMSLRSYEHQELPFEMLVDVLQPVRDSSRNPIFDVGFQYQNVEVGELKLKGLRFEEIDSDFSAARLDLMLSMTEGDAGKIKGTLEYNTDLYSSWTIERMGRHYLKLLEEVLENPEAKLSELEIMGEEELFEQLVQWNETRVIYPSQQGVISLIEAQVDRTPDLVAVKLEGEELSYRGLNEQANQLAHYLVEKGVRANKVVGLCVKRSLEMIVGMLGIMKAGGVFLPLDPRYPSDRILFMMNDTNAGYLLTQESNFGAVEKYEGEKIVLDREDAEFREYDRSNLQVELDEEDLAYIVYTSGTTGSPKGVMVRQRNLKNNIFGINNIYQIQEGDRMLQFTTITFDPSFEEILPILMSGGTIVMHKDPTELVGTSLLEFIEKEQINYIHMVASVFHQSVMEMDRLDVKVPDCLKFVHVGAEPLELDRLLSWSNRVEKPVRFINAYGPTENTCTATLYEMISSPEAELPKSRIPIGKPIPNVRIYLLDKNKKPVPIGLPGEIYIGGESVTAGYLHQPEQTNGSFLPDPFNEKENAFMYRTGDIARFLPDGNLLFLGRADDQVKLRGYRIELREIENALRTHPQVHDAVVLLREDVPGVKQLVAYLVGDEEGVSKEIFHQYLADRLPVYMIPGVYVWLEELPLTQNGKIDRERLPVPDIQTGEIFVPAQTPLEIHLTAMWAELLGVEEISVQANFFELGGNSLLGATFINRLKGQLGENVKMVTIFEKPTIYSLSLYLEEKHPLGVRRLLGETIKGDDEEALKIKSVSREGYLPLSFAQWRLWYMHRLEPSGYIYNVPNFFRLAGELDLEAFQKGLNIVIERHEVLRTRFPIVDGNAVQVIEPPFKLDIPIVDLSEMPENDREEEANRLTTEEVYKPFDLENGPLIRVRLIKVGDQDHIVLITLHHIVSDAWSLGILIREFSVAYEAHLYGKSVDLPELPIQYVDYAVWQRSNLKGDVLESQMRYWRNQLTPLPPALELPTARVRPRVQTFKGERQVITLPASDVSMAKSFNKETNTTLFMIFLAGYLALLHRYTGETDISVGTPVANRGRMETEGLIGFFVNMLVMRGDLSGDPTFRELLERVREMALDAFNYQELPFEMIVEDLHPAQDSSRNPLFQIGFQFQNADVGELQLPGLVLKGLHPDFGVARLDLMLSLTEAPGDLIQGVFRYNTDLFDRETIERLDLHYRQLLSGLLSNPDRPISHIPLLTETARDELVNVRNETNEPYPEYQGIHELWEEQVRKTPQAIALRVNSDELTYAALNERANQLAHTLIRKGVRKNIVVGLFLDRSLEMMIGLLGILKAGGVYLPMDPGYPIKRLEFMIEDAGVRFMVTREDLLKDIPGFDGTAICLDRDIEEIRWNSPHNPEKGSFGDDLVYIIYTSGTTGIPKGVQVRHRNLVNHAWWMRRRLGMEVGERILGYFSISFDGAVDWIYPALLNGGTIVIAKTPAELVGARLLDFIEEEKINYLHLPASVFHHTANEMERLERKVPESLKLILLGGEQVNLMSFHIWSERLNKPMRFLNAYGPTETTVTATMFEEVCYPGKNYVYPRVPIGRPVPNVRIYVLDERGEPVPDGLPGELYIGGAGVTAGYLNRDGENEVVFVTNRFSGEGKLYRTGDMVRYLGDGNLIYLGRRDEQVKLRGYRIELGEIEAVLREEDGVKEAVVILREDIPGVKVLVAYLVGDEGIEEDLNERLGKRLPAYMVPGAYVWMEKIPLTPNGKIDRRGLPIPELSRGERYIGPRTRLEEVLTELWGELLGQDEVSVKANFFDLGGNSLLGATLINRLQEELGEYLYLVALFDAPTIEKLSAYLEQNYPTGVRRLLGEEVDVEQGTTVIRRINDDDFDGLRRMVKKLAPRDEEEKAPINDPAVFILSAPRSGSTLLRVMLGGNPKLFAPPELQLMNYNTLKEQEEAFSNERDSFWLDGVVVALMNLRGWSEAEARKALGRWAEEGMSVRAFYGKMQSWLGDRLFVDKTPNYALDPSMLQRMEENFRDVKYIHLIRHPYAMIPSFEKAKLHVFYPPFLKGETHLTVKEMAEAIWTISQEHIEGFLKEIPEERQLRVSYEGLVTKPEEVIGQVCEFLEIEIHEDMLKPQDDPEKRMTGALHELSQMIGDIRFFEHEGISASGAYRWQEAYRGDCLAEKTWQIAERLGYLREDLPDKVETSNHFLTVEQTQPLVAIQPKGSKPPLFLGHAGGGIIFPYYNLVPYMHDQPIYGLQDPSVYSDELTYSTLEEMAEDYVRWIQKVQPKGPYRLAGWSFGGTLVFEIAHNLIRKGEKIAFLGAIDTWLKPPDLFTVRKEDIAQRKIEKVIASWKQIITRVFKILKGTVSVSKSIIPHLRNGFYFMLSRKLSSEDKKRKLSQVANRILGIAMTTEFLQGSDFAELAHQEKHLLELNIPSSMGRVLQLVRIHQKYANNYKPQPLPSKIHVIYGDWKRKDIENTGVVATLGWEEYSTVGVEIVWTTGNHSSLFTKPDVEALAKKINQLLDESSTE